MRQFWLAVSFAVFVAPPAFAQYPYLIPNQLSIGLGGVIDQRPRQTSPTLSLAFGFRDQGNWGVVFGGEMGPTADASLCQQSPDGPNCMDAALLCGVQRFLRDPSAGFRPSIDLLAGSYYKGSGVLDDDPMFTSHHFAMQIGMGVELRPQDSLHGVGLSVHYRHVFAGGADRDQVRVLVMYVLGPRRRPPAPSGSR